MRFSPDLRSEHSLWKVLLICLGILVILNSIILGIRFSSTMRQSDLASTSGNEEMRIYGIWKIQHGYPLYDWPNREHYTLHMYNYLFYYSYAKILSIFGIKNVGILFYGKILALVFTLLGSISLWYLLRYFVKEHDSFLVNFYIAMIVFTVWLGTNYASWWVLAVRPDVPAVAFAILALLMYVRGSDKNSLLLLLFASFLFFLSWSFKQDKVWILAGTSLYALIYKRNWRQTIVLILPCISLVALCLIFGGEKYRYNILFAPSFLIMPISETISQSIREFFKIFLSNLLLWSFLIYIPILFFVLKKATIDFKKKKDPYDLDQKFEWRSNYILLIFILIVSFLSNFLSLGAAGASRNHILEVFVIGAAISTISLIKIINVADLKTRKFCLITAILLVLSMIALPTIQIVFFNKVGRLTLISNKEYAKRTAFADYLKSLSKPIFIRNLLFALPWHATDNKYPTVMIDNFFYYPAKKKNILHGSGVCDLIISKYFHSLLISKRDEVYSCAINVGYKAIPLPHKFNYMNLELLSLDNSSDK